MRTTLQVGISALLLTSAIRAQKDTFVPANDVGFTITTNQKHYRSGTQIIVNYKIVNISAGKLYVPREWEARCPANPHVRTWFENSSGQHFIPGWASSCSPTNQTVTQRMKKEAVLLKPGQKIEDTVSLESKLSGGLRPGSYRIEALLIGWKDNDFSAAEQSELQKMGAPFMRGEVPASTRIFLDK